MSSGINPNQPASASTRINLYQPVSTRINPYQPELTGIIPNQQKSLMTSVDLSLMVGCKLILLYGTYSLILKLPYKEMQRQTE